MKKIGFIDYFLDQYHAENYPNWIREASGGEMEVAYAWAKMDRPGGKSNRQCCKETGMELLPSPEEVIERSDCLIVSSPDNAEMHEELCRLPLASGKPTYVDKTFAPDRETARRIIQMAEAGHTPFFSTSALRFSKEYTGLKKDGIEAIPQPRTRTLRQLRHPPARADHLLDGRGCGKNHVRGHSEYSGVCPAFP